MSLLSTVVAAPIHFYRRFISPMQSPRCRYAPTCSTYALEAIKVHGAVKGTILATWRVMRCNPWTLGGVDHVPPKGSWKPEPWQPPEDWDQYDGEIPVPDAMDGVLDHAGSDGSAGSALVNEMKATTRPTTPSGSTKPAAAGGQH